MAGGLILIIGFILFSSCLAHNNLNLALKNSITAIKNGFNWIDSTILGMGRGPGNLKTEDILKTESQ